MAHGHTDLELYGNQLTPPAQPVVTSHSNQAPTTSFPARASNPDPLPARAGELLPCLIAVQRALTLPCSFAMLILLILEITHQSVVSRTISRHTARLIFCILSHIILYLRQLLIYNDSDITSLRSASSLMWRIHEERNGGLFAQIMSPVPQVLHIGRTQQMSDCSWELFCHCCMRQSNCPLSRQLRTSPNSQTVWVLLATLNDKLLLPSSLHRAWEGTIGPWQCCPLKSPPRSCLEGSVCHHRARATSPFIPCMYIILTPSHKRPHG